jgi:hypothetical protein
MGCYSVMWPPALCCTVYGNVRVGGGEVVNRVRQASQLHHRVHRVLDLSSL